MAMSRESQLSEHSVSWGVIVARIERTGPRVKHAWTGLWWALGGLLFGTGLLFSAYALTDRDWVLWLGMLAPLAIVLLMAMRAANRSDRALVRTVSLDRLESGTMDYLGRPRPW